MQVKNERRSDLLDSLGITRAERRQLIREQAKRLGKFQFEVRDDYNLPPHPDRCLASGQFWIMEKNMPGGFVRAMIGRHDKSTEISWKDKQIIKCCVYGEDAWAVECYPPVSELSDEGNIYWLHVAPEGWRPEWERS